MKLIVGLGNPGIEYQFTPHNIGFLIVDRLAEQLGLAVTNRRCQSDTASGYIGQEPIVLAKPDTFMNLSGVAVGELVERVTPDAFDLKQDLIVVYDELDLPLGRMQIRERGGSAGHNGIKSILGALETEEWLRVRVGVSPEHKPGSGKQYLLAPFRKTDLPLFDEAIEKAATAVRAIVTDGVQAAMNKFNRRPDEPQVTSC
ncbi:MAG: aminoacyl-tRNA hydrolase [Acidobacteriales bacterium]|nr:aminoacyl-tRNA hydrolase [Terriglobales bacterium]